MSKTKVLATAAFIVTASFAGTALTADTAVTKPETIVLVHGAFADSSSWNGVMADLKQDGYAVLAVANPLRGLQADADYVSRVVKSIPGPVVLVGHSYGGGVITDAAAGTDNVKALVYVAGFAPDVGETPAGLGALYPTGTLGETLAAPIEQADGSKDLYIDQSKFWVQFAADLPEDDAVLMAASQRPILESAFTEATVTATWKTIPSWFIYGSLDKNIPNTLHAFMGERAAAKEVVEIEGASHVVMMSHPQEVSAMIERAAAAE